LKDTPFIDNSEYELLPGRRCKSKRKKNDIKHDVYTPRVANIQKKMKVCSENNIIIGYDQNNSQFKASSEIPEARPKQHRSSSRIDKNPPVFSLSKFVQQFNIRNDSSVPRWQHIRTSTST
jgi:hypothetical protein